MPDFIKIVLLAIVQGLTEFLPVSSSGHLGLAKHLLGVESPNILLEVTAHVGTLISVIVYYRTDISKLADGIFARDRDARRTLGFLIVSVLPIAILGALTHTQLEPLFNSTRFIALMLIVTALSLLSLFMSRRFGTSLGLRHVVVMGIAQAMAILPGISRSGLTIVAARHAGIDPDEAAEFSLLMLIPAVGGAIVISIGDIIQSGMGTLTIVDLLITLGVSAAVGYAAIAVLIRALNSGRFPLFGIYCLAVGVLALIRL